MTSDSDQAITAEGSKEAAPVRVSNVVQFHRKIEEIDTGFQAIDAEYHAAGFCACCMRGE